MTTITLEKIETTERPQTSLKISLKRDAFLNALMTVNRSVSTRSTLPILAHFLIEAHEGHVSISATNLETGIRLCVDAHIEHEGVCAIGAKTLLDCVKALPKGGDVTIEVGEHFVLSCGKRIFALNYWRDASEFPAFPRTLDSEPVAIAGDTLRTAIKEVEFAAANDDSRPVFTSMGVHIRKNAVNLVSMDGFRMAVRTVAHADDRNVMLLVPISAMRLLAEVTPKGVDVEITWNQKLSQVIFQAGPLTVVSRLIEGTFPKYSQAIPKEHRTVFTLGRKDLEQILKAFLPFAKDSSNMLKVFYTGESVTFLAESEDLGSVRDELSTIIEGEDGHIILNIVYLSEMLKAVQAQCFTFFLSGEARPALIVPLGRDDYQYVLMPMSKNR
jgi:DNA polymerase-3 subunit beta